ncbi:uncharacterized protein LOC134791367 [Cydia splendana]|uniref:uncharacterized protein LOC134791367 n=1 Tax=Cydia splendana TaxID=1100963 RepID=UPI00300C6606
MMDKLWVVLLVALTGAHFGQGLPLRSTPHSYPHNTNGSIPAGWKGGSLYAAVPALALIVTAVGLLFGCTWCYRHKDCKQNEGADNQLFTASATHLHERRSHPPDSGFSEPANNNISEDNNNGPISLREMQNIANNNATAYIVSENEERNRVSRESVVEFEPLPTGIRVADPLERCVDWFGDEDFPRNRLQYLREIGRGWFGRVVEGEIEDEGTTTTVAVKILNQNASLEDKARFLDEARLYRDASHENVLAFVASCLQEDPWILIFELCSTDLQNYLTANRPMMAALNESGVPLRLMCDVTSALSYLHSRGYTYGELCTQNVLIRGSEEAARAVLGHYGLDPRPNVDNIQHMSQAGDVSSLGYVLRDICSWAAAPPPAQPDCPYREHLHQVMQLCWHENPDSRPGAAQVQALLEHLHSTHMRCSETRDDGYGSSDFEERWQRLKPNTIPKLDEHRALVHAPSTSVTSHFTGSEELSAHCLSVDMDTAVSRSSSIMSDKDPLSVQIKSESLTNLHGSLEDVRNIYLTHNEQAVLECHQANTIEDRDDDRSDASVDPWLKEIIAGSQDDVSYYKDVSDVIKNLDNILNSEKTSSSESSHQASPSRDNLSLDCKKDYPMQSSMVKSPGITNFQNIIQEVGLEDKSPEKKQDEDEDRDTIGTLSHSFERHSDTTSQHTLENLTPDTPIKDMELPFEKTNADLQNKLHAIEISEDVQVEAVLPKESEVDNSDSVKTNICITPMHSVNEDKNVYVSEDCQTPSDNKLTDILHDKETVQAKSISEVSGNNPVCNNAEEVIIKTVQSLEQNVPVNVEDKEVLPVFPEVVQNDKATDLLPNAPLEEKHATDLRLETTNINSQKEINNDLISPAESTTDSKITPFHMIALEESSSVKVENLDNVSQIAFESPHRLEESQQGDSPLPTYEEKGESDVPESVQIISAVPVIESFLTGSHNKGDVEVDLKSITETDVSKNTEEELVTLVEKEVVVTNAPINVTTPTLILSEAQEDKQLSIDKLPEEFIDKIIKEAETAALNCIETARAKTLVPEPLNIPKNEMVEIFLNTEIKSLNNSTAYNITHDTGAGQDILQKQTSSQDSQHNFLKEEVKLPSSSNLDNITKEILLDAMHEVPKVMQKVESLDFFHDNNLKVTPTSDAYLRECETKAPEIESLPDVVRDVTHSIDQPIDKQVHRDKENTNTQIGSQSVVPQISLDLESTASADSSQSTFLIKDTLKEKSKIVSESPVDILLDEPVREIVEPEVNMETVINTFLDSEKRVTESLCADDTLKPTSKLPSQNETEVIAVVAEETIAKDNIIEQNAIPKSNTTAVENGRVPSDDSTAYMDLTDSVKAEIVEQNPMDDNIKDVINSCLETPGNDSCSLVKLESTEYLDLPTVVRDVDEFLHAERQLSSQVDEKDPLCSSTPKSLVDDTPNSTEEKSDVLTETKVPDYGPGVTLTKLEQQCVPDFLSPFDSPTKSHPTDTYDENSSVVLGPFENCTMELFKGIKSGEDLGDIPKEEMFFSSNFSEINLETPSPLRDGNFLNEVPDIVNDDNFLDIISDPNDEADSKTDASDVTDQSVAEKKVSPSTPPNSPGYFLASTSQQKYLVDIDLNPATEPAPVESDSGLSSLHKEIELNQIELQITSKLAMAENENNLNIEYSGPLTVEGLVQNDLVREEESAPETFLAGNGGNIDDIREMFTLDEDCVNALRNELELKLPLAQVAAIEPSCESESSSASWSELPPPPELVVSYPGALSPIAEETGPQLSAYENDVLWNASLRTESSESYPSPCNNSTEEPTEPPTGQDTYTLPGRQSCTQPQTSSREITMSADSLNASPAKTGIDDRTFTVDEGRCERISQVSPFVLSPTTDSSATAVTGVSTLSKTTQPTDIKPSETLSKATSIDSWCSNDTLYNVEEAFDDIASDQDLPPDFDPEKDDNSESDTLTLDDEKELSHISTYIVHDSKSDDDRFSPDSITANDNDNHTYTKARASPTKSEGSKTKDLAYGTMTGPYSNCTTEILSADNAWMLPQPELVRRSPIDFNVDISAPTPKECEEVDSPKLKSEPCVKKMDSVEITCLEDNLLNNESPKRDETHGSPHCHYDMGAGVTSTPLTEIPSEESTPSTLAVDMRTPENLPNIVPNYQSFMLSAELRQQETDVHTFPYESEVSEESRLGSEATPSFIEFMHAATSKPQETSRLHSSQNGSGDFERFENSLKTRPQDLSHEKEAPTEDSTRPSQPRTLVLSPPSITNFKESHVGKNTVIITDLEEDETEQPHSIIIAEISKEKDSPNRTFDSHIVELNHTYDSHMSRKQMDGALKESNSDNSKEITINGTNDDSHDMDQTEVKSPETKTEETKHKETINNVDTLKDIPNGTVSKVNNCYEIKCNGNSEKFATVNFISESFEELVESNVDDGDCKETKNDDEILEDSEVDKTLPLKDSPVKLVPEQVNGVEEKMVAVTEDFLQNEKKFCQLDVYLPLLSDIRFTGPASEIMSTSFTQDSPTEPTPEGEGNKPGDVKEWDSDTDSHSSNSSSGEFIWKGGDGQETSVVPTTHFDHRGSNGSAGRAAPGSGSASGSGSGSGSEGDEVEFVPSSWDCRAEPAKSSLRSLPVSQDNKKRVVFKRQKYHCVYEYPRELATVDADSPAYLPDLSTYSEWDPGSAEEAELGYGQLFGAASPLDLYPLRGTIAFGADYDEDFFISSSARPFESLGVMSTTSQFFPGMRLKPLDLPADDDFPPPPSPLAPLPQTRTPSLDFTTPDSGVEDITPGSTSTDEDFKTKKLEDVTPWRSIDSGSSSESVSPSSPGGEALGGLRHTRDKLKLDLPPSPHIPSPRHNRVFNFVLDKPKRRAADDRSDVGTTPLVMTDETPLVTGSLPVPDCEDVPVPEPTFSTFGKTVPRADPEQKIILTDDGEKAASPVKEPVRGEGTVLDSGDEDSGIESSAKTTLERKTPNVS